MLAMAPVTPLITRLGTKFPGLPLLPKVLFQPQHAVWSRCPAMAVFFALIWACVSPTFEFAKAAELKKFTSRTQSVTSMPVVSESG